MPAAVPAVLALPTPDAVVDVAEAGVSFEVADVLGRVVELCF